MTQKLIRDDPSLAYAFLNAGTVVLCANDDSELPPELQKESLTGLRSFLASAPSDAIILIVSEDDGPDTHEMQLIPGGNGLIPSCELVTSLIRAGQLSDFSVSIQSFLLTFYRFKWVDGSEEAALCLENGFQAAKLIVSDKTASPQIERFASALSKLLSEVTLSNGTQYSIINTGNQVISISEQLYTIILFIILAVSLLGNCLFSFMFGKRKIENRIIFLKWWYVGPLLILISFGLTFISKTLVLSLIPDYALHPGFALIFKTTFTFILFLLLCELRYIVPLAETDYLYAFFMTLAAALDVFIFTSADMPLLLPFSLFYIIILGARAIKKWWLNLIMLILLAVPLAFVFINAYPYLRNDIFSSFISSSPVLDFFTGALLLPYMLMVIRILVGSGIWNVRKPVKYKIIEFSLITVLLCTVILLSINCFRTSPLTGEITSTDDFTSYSSGSVTGHAESEILIEADGTFSNGMFDFELQLSSDSQVLRYDIAVSSESAVPLYSANLPFSFAETAGNAVFNLDENPCNPFTVSGTTPANLPFIITITAFLKDGTSVIEEEHTVSFISEYENSTHPGSIIR